MIRTHVVSAIFWRNVKQYFSGVLGYLFIVVFVTICAVMTFSSRFFNDNLANLDQLSQWFPMLLLFFIPAITMSIWADEKRQGTDSILFTLPASDLDILLGKFLAVVAVYTIALLFSMTQLIPLAIIGDPDWGVVTTTYLGYWLAGLALLAIGTFASSLTQSATIAFVLGALLCSIPVLIGSYFRGAVWLERFGIDWNLQDFTIGLIPLTNVIYFLLLTLVMLYLNLVVISHRHWSRGNQVSLGGHFLVRVIALAVACIAAVLLCSGLSSLWTQADLTAENLYTLDKATIATLEKAKENERAVTIQAFISDEVPRKYVDAKKRFVGMLRQFSDTGGQYVDVRFVDVKPNSREEVQAAQLGIEPRPDRSDVNGNTVERDVYLGARISSSLDDVTLPFVGDESSIEYELSRSIANAVDQGNQLTVGILDSDAHFGGPEVDGRRLPWAYASTIDDLKKQFKIKYLTGDDLADYVGAEPPEEKLIESEGETSDEEGDETPEKRTPPHVLIVADPASLDQPTTESLIKYLEAGNPAVILADPLPFFWAYQNPVSLGVINAPNQPRVSPQSPYAQILTSSAMPKADGGKATTLMNALGVKWDSGRAVWNLSDPHPGFKGEWPPYLGAAWPEYYGPYDHAFVFIVDEDTREAFNPDSPITAGLNELLLFYPGSVSAALDSKLAFTPLITLGVESGSTAWDELTMTPTQTTQYIDPRTGQIRTEDDPARSQITQDSLFVINPNPRSYIDKTDHVVAAHIQGEGDQKVNVVFIADLDFVSDLREPQEAALESQLDNLSLLQNAIEVLSGADQFISLRNRRPKPRTLTRLESIFRKYRADRVAQQQVAEQKVQDELDEAQKELDAAASEIDQNESLSFFEKLQQTSMRASDVQSRFELKQKRLDRELKEQITEMEIEEQQLAQAEKNRFRFWSIFAAPLPAIMLGIAVLWVRMTRENKNIRPDRRVEKHPPGSPR